MTSQELHADLNINGYINPDGIITVSPHSDWKPGEGNGLLQTGLFYCIKYRHGLLTQVDMDRIDSITIQCSHAVYPILYRSPWKKNPDDQESADDYWGWLPACKAAKSIYPEKFLAFAERSDWIIDVQNPDKPDPIFYFERFIGFTTMTKLCAGKRISPFESLQLALNILWASFNVDKSDSNIKTYCAIASANEESLLSTLAAIFWFKKIRNKYGYTGMAFANYFKDPNHPLCRGDWI